MGHPSGFLDFTRELPAKRSVADRVKDYREFVLSYTEEKLNQQSSRCMNCGVPFCHNGCPLGNRIPEFNDAVYQQRWKEAYDVLSSTNNFPEFTGRICPAPCEAACVLGINQPAVTIEEIEKHIIETAFTRGFVHPQLPATRSGKKVAVIGSGPAGLAAAAQLNYAGHLVTVFEKGDAPGGLLRYGIPDFKLEKWVVDRRLNILMEEGVVFRCNIDVGRDIHIDDLRDEYDAIVLAGGSSVPRDLAIPGRELKGIHFAMDFLTQQNKRIAGVQCNGENILAHNKNVIVIGGGDTGSDCVGTSNRQGARNVTQFELMPRPPENRTPLMPWPIFPMIFKTTSSHEEGAERYWTIATKAFIGNEAGQLTALKVVDVEWKMSGGNLSAQYIEIKGSEREIPCDLALLALGFLSPSHEGLIESLALTFDGRGNVHTSGASYQTSISGIFSAGDMRRGQSLVVWAISEGRECAQSVHEYLSAEKIHLETELNTCKNGRQ
jgi:glutamate synthase (NADPH/NADH) small chain